MILIVGGYAQSKIENDMKLFKEEVSWRDM
jgi:hypothetical protein